MTIIKTFIERIAWFRIVIIFRRLKVVKDFSIARWLGDKLRFKPSAHHNLARIFRVVSSAKKETNRRGQKARPDLLRLENLI